MLPLEDGEYVVRDIYSFEIEGLDPDGKLQGKHVFTGEKPTFLKDAELQGITMDPAWFGKK